MSNTWNHIFTLSCRSMNLIETYVYPSGRQRYLHYYHVDLLLGGLHCRQCRCFTGLMYDTNFLMKAQAVLAACTFFSGQPMPQVVSMSFVSLSFVSWPWPSSSAVLSALAKLTELSDELSEVIDRRSSSWLFPRLLLLISRQFSRDAFCRILTTLMLTLLSSAYSIAFKPNRSSRLVDSGDSSRSNETTDSMLSSRDRNLVLGLARKLYAYCITHHL